MISIQQELMQRLRQRRKEAKISQLELANRSGVSFGSVKRFENSGEISLSSLIKLAFALGYENDFNNLFTRKNYQSIQDVIDESK